MSRAIRTRGGGRPISPARTATSPASPRGPTPRSFCGSSRSETRHENNTWDHYQDNRLQWWLGAGSAAHLRATRNAGVIGLLFGAGASGNTTQMTDGGFFYRLARRYEQHPLSLTQPL